MASNGKTTSSKKRMITREQLAQFLASSSKRCIANQGQMGNSSKRNTHATTAETASRELFVGCSLIPKPRLNKSIEEQGSYTLSDQGEEASRNPTIVRRSLFSDSIENESTGNNC